MVEVDFVRQLYRNQFSYADRLTDEQLDNIHCSSPELERSIVSHLREGRIVFLTGNPGDGKTHLIQRLRPQWESLDTFVLPDFNVLEPNQRQGFQDTIRSLVAARSGALIAANEFPLLTFIGDFADDIVGLRGVQDQMRASLVYTPEDRPIEGPFVVLDLNLRQCLGADVVGAVLDNLTNLSPCPVCGADCPVHRNNSCWYRS